MVTKGITDWVRVGLFSPRPDRAEALDQTGLKP